MELMWRLVGKNFHKRKKHSFIKNDKIDSDDELIVSDTH